MSIVLSTAPDEITSGYNAIDFGVTSSRNSRKQLTVTGVTDNGGFCRFATSSDPTAAPALQVGDIVLGSGFTATLYNALMTVTAVDAAYFETDLGFVTNDTGVITRRNDNFKIKATVYRKSTVWTTGTRTDSGGFYAFDSAIITEDTVSVGDYLFYRTSATAFHRITSVVGNVAVTATPALSSTPTTVQLCVASAAGVMYAQPDEISAASVVKFDIKNLINVYFTPTIYTFGSTNIQSATDQPELQVYAIIFEEIYEDKDGLYNIPASGSLITGAYDALNAVNQVYEDQDLDDFILDTSPLGDFLTDIPAMTTMHIDEEKQISFISKTEIVQLAYRTTTFAGVTSAWASLADVTTNPVSFRYYRATAILSKLNVISSNTKILEVKIQNAANADLSNTLTFFIDQKKYETNRVLLFRNRRGGMDSYNYSVINETVLDLEKEYSRNGGAKSTAMVRGMLSLELESRFDNKATFEWLEQLYESRDVYMLDSRYSSGYVRVNITDSSHIVNSMDLFSSIITVDLQEPLRA